MSFRGMMTYPNWAARSPWFMILTIASEIGEPRVTELRVGHEQDSRFPVLLGRDVDACALRRDPHGVELCLDQDMRPFPDLPAAQHASTGIANLGLDVRKALVGHG